MATAATTSPPTLEDARRAAAAIEAAAGDGLAQILLYGSVARGEQHEYSDIDLLVVFDDLDYSSRYAVKQRLEKVATEAVGYDCQVHATDLPEWETRQKVSSSFECNITPQTQCLVKLGGGQVDWSKAMVKAVNNQQAAAGQARRIARQVAELANSAFFKTSEGESDDEHKEFARIARIRSACRHASDVIELSLKMLVTLSGKHLVKSKDLKELRHDIEKALREIPNPLQQELRTAIKERNIEVTALSSWHVEDIYEENGFDIEEEMEEEGLQKWWGDQETLGEYADFFVDDYVHLSLSIAWTALEEVKAATRNDPKAHLRLEKLESSLVSATSLYQARNISSGEPLPGGGRETAPPQSITHHS